MVVASIDTGGTKIAGAAVDETGKILHKVRYPNSGRTGRFILDTYIQIIEALRREYPVEAIGIGAGGRINPRTGTVSYAVDIYRDYIGLEIQREIQKHFDLPVAVDNDCRVAVYGERWMGAARGYREMVGIILGTGVGGGIISEDRPTFGWRGGSGEIGHMILHPGGHPCGCGQQGCCEQYLSGTSLWKSYNRQRGEEQISSGQELFVRLKAGDSCAKEVLNRFVEDLALFTLSLGNLLDPEAILFGGGLLDTADEWWDEFLASYCRISGPFLQKIQFLRATNGNDAALLGAAWIALRQIQAIG